MRKFHFTLQNKSNRVSFHLHCRYEEEKDALMARLKGSDAQFLSEKQRQAELIRLRREQRMAQQEEKFGAAALVLGLAERNQANVESK